MQDRYAGDIGDFVKLAILRALKPRRKLGIAWWLYPDESHNDDGKHVRYLQNEAKWRGLDPDVFDRLAEIVRSGRRHIAALQDDALLTDTVFFSELVPAHSRTTLSLQRRRGLRAEWFARLQTQLDGCDLVFLDPDNGLETSKFDLGASKAGKSVAISELMALRRPGREIVVYHHHTRRKGGHALELEYWGERLREAGFTTAAALRA
ncbi:MAG: hypothetical protein H7345_05110, partial [Rubritepida sp.]|nr:hypothetical protein [Rubritepida sp.]